MGIEPPQLIRLTVENNDRPVREPGKAPYGAEEVRLLFPALPDPEDSFCGHNPRSAKAGFGVTKDNLHPEAIDDLEGRPF